MICAPDSPFKTVELLWWVEPETCKENGARELRTEGTFVFASAGCNGAPPSSLAVKLICLHIDTVLLLAVHSPACSRFSVSKHLSSRWNYFARGGRSITPPLQQYCSMLHLDFMEVRNRFSSCSPPPNREVLKAAGRPHKNKQYEH